MTPYAIVPTGRRLEVRPDQRILQFDPAELAARCHAYERNAWLGRAWDNRGTAPTRLEAALAAMKALM